MNISHFRNVINFIRKEIYADFALPQLELFLFVVENEGISHGELSKLLNMPQPTVSRNVNKLADKVAKRFDGSFEKVGYGLLENRSDEVESRSDNVLLTNKGKEFAKTLKFVLQE